MKQLLTLLPLFAGAFTHLLAIGAPILQGATVWSGYEHTFSKPDNVDPFSPTWQDEITGNVAITRGNFGGGLFNAASETFYNADTSPAGTLWAFPFNNPGELIAASNWSNLDFHPWAIAFGRSGNGGPPAHIEISSVMYSVTDDSYIDVRLTAWTIRAGGGFSYERARRPASGDFDASGKVNGRDFLDWQRGWSPDPLSSSDLELWQAEYGNVALMAIGAVPEPSALTLVVFTSVSIVLGGRQELRNPARRKASASRRGRRFHHGDAEGTEGRVGSRI